ncbi:amidohydrolase family protein [Aspergillus filifer]
MANKSQFPVVDSHIHLFPESHLPSLAWYNPSEPGPLGTSYSVEQYKTASKASSAQVRGFIFLETDRLSSVNETGKHGWTHALDEVSFLSRIARGTPLSSEGHTPNDKSLVLGIVPWAPVPGGPEVLEKYMGLVRERAGNDEVWRRVCGVRYLVQDKEPRTMLQTPFLEGLKWLGRQGLSFDLGVDARQGGIWQLEEAVEMLRQVYESADDRSSVRIVINHLCKPNLRLQPESTTTHPDFLNWKSHVTAMSQYKKTYMKLSGAFSELPPLPSETEPDIPSLIDALQPWTDVVFDTFGAERVMFGSDWPVCNVGGGGNEVTWGRWRVVVEGILERRELSDDQKRGVWGGVALEAYGATI